MAIQNKVKTVFLLFVLLFCSSCGHSNSANSNTGAMSTSPVGLAGCVTLNCASAPDNKAFYSKVSSKAFDRRR